MRKFYTPNNTTLLATFLAPLIFLLVSIRAFATISDVQFSHYTVADGLSQNTVTDIVEDKHGFIWFATLDGLNRFDGYEFKYYQHDDSRPDSIADSFIRDLFVDDDGELWVATESGLSRYNENKDNFVNYNNRNSGLTGNQIRTIATAKENELFVTDESRIYVFNKKNEEFQAVKFKGHLPPPETTTILKDGNITWIGSYSSGIFIADNNSNTLYDTGDSNPWNLNLSSKKMSDIKIINNEYWLATENGVVVVSKDLKKVKVYSSSTPPKLANNVIRSITQVDTNHVWIGTIDGISILDLKKNSVENITKDNDIFYSLNDSFVLSVLKDRNDTIWLGTYTGGIHKYNPENENVKHFKSIPHSDISLSDDMIWAIHESLDGKIWIATQSGGVNLYDPISGEFTHFLKDTSQNIWDMTFDSENRLWLATSEGMKVYSVDKNNKKLLLVKNITTSQWEELLVYGDEKMWLKSSNSNQLFWVDAKNFKRHSVTLPSDSIHLVRPTLFDSQGKLWILTNIGIYLYNIHKKTFSQLTFETGSKSLNFNFVIETETGFWVSATDSTLLKVDKETHKTIAKFDFKDNQINNAIINLMYKDGIIWVATFDGLTSISERTGDVIREINTSMLNYDELNEKSGIITSNNKLIVGGSQGIHIIDSIKSPSKKLGIQHPPSITKIEVKNKSLNSINSPDLISGPIFNVKKITLPYDATPIGLTFASINPATPKGVQYRYRLNGLSDEWLEGDIRTRQAVFNNLMFGDYSFEVQSKNPLEDWSKSQILDITIAPPIWLHRNALILYSALALLLMLVWLKQTKNKLAVQQAIKESEERLKLTLWSSGDELWDWDIYQGQVFRANTWGVLDFPQDNIRANSSYQANIHPNDVERLQASLREHLQDKIDYFEITYRVRTYKGEWIWVLDRGKVVLRDANQQPVRMTGTLKNISHLKKAEEQLKLFKRSIETISDGVFITNTDFRFISVNNAYCKYTGETREQALASYLHFHQYPSAFTEEVKKALRQRGNWIGEVESRRTNGDKYEIELNIDAIHDEDGKTSHYVGVFSDITTRKSTEKELLKLANTDPLTELPNRSFFQASHSNMVRKNVSHALLCLDMDNFKKINDSLGHQTGDVLIKQIAKRLQRLIGRQATSYRLGGDEFSILIDNDNDVHRITHLAQSILDDMNRPFLINKQEFVLSASIGISCFPEDGSNSQELLKNADTAMYFAKNAGGNKYQFFSGDMNQNAVRQLQIENLIRHGLKEDLFTVYYQPKVDIASGKLVSMEALVRYEHPEKGLVSPAQFIPLAEQTGQIIEIGEIVLRKACEDTKRWVQEGLFSGRVAINFSAKQFELPDLDQRIDTILNRSGLSPLHLECEITEGTLMENPEHSLRMMERLRERGIHLALDDFGTGYSSLAYLKRFPLNTLKIDKAFIKDIATSSVDKHMTAAIINIAHNLGLKVVAEGVEEEKQLSILRQYQCEMLQGYLYSKPISASRFERLLRENHQLHTLIQP